MTDPRTTPVYVQETVITRLDIPFGNLIAFFVKAGLAAIPAVIILWFIGFVFWAIVRFAFTGSWGWMMHRWTM